MESVYSDNIRKHTPIYIYTHPKEVLAGKYVENSDKRPIAPDLISAYTERHTVLLSECVRSRGWWHLSQGSGCSCVCTDAISVTCLGDPPCRHVRTVLELQ